MISFFWAPFPLLLLLSLALNPPSPPPHLSKDFLTRAFIMSTRILPTFTLPASNELAYHTWTERYIKGISEADELSKALGKNLNAFCSHVCSLTIMRAHSYTHTHTHSLSLSIYLSFFLFLTLSFFLSFSFPLSFDISTFVASTVSSIQRVQGNSSLSSHFPSQSSGDKWHRLRHRVLWKPLETSAWMTCTHPPALPERIWRCVYVRGRKIWVLRDQREYEANRYYCNCRDMLMGIMAQGCDRKKGWVWREQRKERRGSHLFSTRCTSSFPTTRAVIVLWPLENKYPDRVII